MMRDGYHKGARDYKGWSTAVGRGFPNNQWGEGGQSIGVSHGLETEPQDDDIKPFSWDRFSL